jgi:predicted nucleotidyltransferase
MHAILTAKSAAIAAAARRYGVRRLEVVGSAARAADFDPEHSDIDFLVTFETAAGLPPLEQFFGLKDTLANLLGRPVDLIEASAVTNPYLKREFDAARELVFAACKCGKSKSPL